MSNLGIPNTLKKSLVHNELITYGTMVEPMASLLMSSCQSITFLASISMSLDHGFAPIGNWKYGDTTI